MIDLSITNLAAVPSIIAAGILVLVRPLLSMNAAAIWLRDRYQKKGTA